MLVYGCALFVLLYQFYSRSKHLGRVEVLRRLSSEAHLALNNDSTKRESRIPSRDNAN